MRGIGVIPGSPGILCYQPDDETRDVGKLGDTPKYSPVREGKECHHAGEEGFEEASD